MSTLLHLFQRGSVDQSYQPVKKSTICAHRLVKKLTMSFQRSSNHSMTVSLFFQWPTVCYRGAHAPLNRRFTRCPNHPETSPEDSGGGWGYVRIPTSAYVCLGNNTDVTGFCYTRCVTATTAFLVRRIDGVAGQIMTVLP